MPVILGAIDRIGKKGNTPYIKVHLIAVSNSRYCIHAANPS